MAYATTDDGVRLYYEDTGAGVPIVFVHEFAGDHRSWEPQVRFFSRRHRCIAYAARGYPPSDVPERVDSYSQKRAAADIQAVMDGAGIERAHVVGLSMGGFATLHFGLACPERALSLVAAGVGYGAEKEREAAVPTGRGGGGARLRDQRQQGVRRDLRRRRRPRAVRGQGPARLARVRRPAGRAFAARRGQYHARRAGEAAVPVRPRGRSSNGSPCRP